MTSVLLIVAHRDRDAERAVLLARVPVAGDRIDLGIEAYEVIRVHHTPHDQRYGARVEVVITRETAT